ncbi:MAG: DUF429 domain-containing protein [Armatimonadota bacterium]|nr:DUF429 domain-containing protein [Armatimonadota bacterium]
MSHAGHRTRNIVAIGGGGFSEEPDNPLLDDFILSLAGRDRPRACFLGTASGDSQQYLDKFYVAFPEGRARACDLSLFRKSEISDLEAFLLDRDVIYVGGGSTVNMLAVWRVHGVDRALRRAWEAGVILAGISAGMVCWFEASLTYSRGGALGPLDDGLGLLPGSACPHYDRTPHQRQVLHRCIANSDLPDGVAADDGAALHFVGTELVEAISSRPGAGAYIVRREGDRAVETALDTRYLGDDAEPRIPPVGASRESAPAASHFIGIDIAAARPCDVIVADGDLRVLEMMRCGGPEAAARDLHQRFPHAVIAVDASRAPNAGLMDQADYRAELRPVPPPERYHDCRVAEYELIRRGVSLYLTPSGAVPAWMEAGFRWYEALFAAGYSDHSRGKATGPGTVIEYYSHASFVALLGGRPPKKSSPEGRRLRVQALREAGMEADFGIMTADMLDAAVGCLTARRFARGEAADYGDPREGVLTVAAKLPDTVRPLEID